MRQTQAQRLDQNKKFAVADFPCIGGEGKPSQFTFLHLYILMLAVRAAAGTDAVAPGIGREKEVDAFIGYAGRGPDASNLQKLRQANTQLLERLASHGEVGRLVADHSGAGFLGYGIPGRAEHSDPKQIGDQSHPSFGVIGQDGDRRAVTLQIAPHLGAVSQAHPQSLKGNEARIDGLDAEHLRVAHRSPALLSLQCRSR